MSARTGARFPSRTLAALIVLGICNHVALSGARVAVSLDALGRGASPLAVASAHSWTGSTGGFFATCRTENWTLGPAVRKRPPPRRRRPSRS